MKAFYYSSSPNFEPDLYIRVIPGKRLFQSNMVHDVVNRGDIFALRVKDSILTIIPGNAEVEHVDDDVTVCNNDFGDILVK